jgi:hypothetical protein
VDCRSVGIANRYSSEILESFGSATTPRLVKLEDFKTTVEKDVEDLNKTQRIDSNPTREP